MKKYSSKLRYAVIPLISTILVADVRAQTNQKPEVQPPAIPPVSAAVPIFTPDVVAKLGDAEVKTDDVRRFLDALDITERDGLLHRPDLLKQAVISLLFQKIVLKEALAKGWDKQANVVGELQRVHDNTVTQTYLQSLFNPPADYPSEAELKTIYDANKSALLVPKRFHLAQIFIASPSDADEAAVKAAKAKLDAVKKALAQPNADFGKVAAAQSDDKASAIQNGVLGWLDQAQIQTDIRSLVANAKPGSVSEPVRLKDGWHFLKVLEVKESYTPSLEQTRIQLIVQLRKQKLQQDSQAYLNKFLQQNSLAINDAAFFELMTKPQTAGSDVAGKPTSPSPKK